jgi:hypothetical protein
LKFTLFLAFISFNSFCGVLDNYEWGGWTKDYYDGLNRTVNKIVDTLETTSGRKGIPPRGPEGYYIQEAENVQTTVGSTNQKVEPLQKRKKLYSLSEANQMMSKYFSSYKCSEKYDFLDFSFNNRFKETGIDNYTYQSFHDGHALITQYPKYVFSYNLKKEILSVLEIYYDCACNKTQKIYYSGYQPFCDNKATFEELKAVNQESRKAKENEYKPTNTNQLNPTLKK